MDYKGPWSSMDNFNYTSLSPTPAQQSPPWCQNKWLFWGTHLTDVSAEANTFDHSIIFLNFLYWLIDWFVRVRERERETSTSYSAYLCSIGWFRYVPWRRIELATLVYPDNALTNWTARPGLTSPFLTKCLHLDSWTSLSLGSPHSPLPACSHTLC